MREIEIKVQLKDAAETLKKLERAGVVMSAPKKQHDVVYCLAKDLHGENHPGTNWLRIRTEDEQTVFFNLKQSLTGSLDSIEHETVVENANELEAILSYLGYVVFSDLTKIRRTGHYGDSIEVCFDEVSPLGSFIELEKLCETDVDSVAVEQELLGIIETLGIEYTQRMTRGYDQLMNDMLASA